VFLGGLTLPFFYFLADKWSFLGRGVVGRGNLQIMSTPLDYCIPRRSAASKGKQTPSRIDMLTTVSDFVGLEIA
jgi:hypothetical protein